MVKENYTYAYREVIELLKYFSLEDIKKIPEDLIKVFLKHMDKEYIYIVDEEKPFQEQEMLEETKVIFAIIFRDYWATDYQREKIIAKEKNDKRKLEEQKAKKYSTENLFKNRNTARIQDTTSSDTWLLELQEETFFSKIIKKIKKLFKRTSK